MIQEKIENHFPFCIVKNLNGNTSHLPHNFCHYNHCIMYLFDYLCSDDLNTISQIRERNPKANIVLIGDENGFFSNNAISICKADVFYSTNDGNVDDLVDLVWKVATCSHKMVVENTNLSCFKNVSGLSNKEREVVDLLTTGMSNKEIANVTGKAEGTVKTQLKSVYKKLNVRNRTSVLLKIREIETIEKGRENLEIKENLLKWADYEQDL